MGKRYSSEITVDIHKQKHGGEKKEMMMRNQLQQMTAAYAQLQQ